MANLQNRNGIIISLDKALTKKIMSVSYKPPYSSGYRCQIIVIIIMKR